MDSRFLVMLEEFGNRRYILKAGTEHLQGRPDCVQPCYAEGKPLWMVTLLKRC